MFDFNVDKLRKIAEIKKKKKNSAKQSFATFPGLKIGVRFIALRIRWLNNSTRTMNLIWMKLKNPDENHFHHMDSIEFQWAEIAIELCIHFIIDFRANWFGQLIDICVKSNANSIFNSRNCEFLRIVCTDFLPMKR